MGEPPSSDAPDGGRPAMTIPKGGVMLPGFSSRKDPQPTNRTPEQRNGDGEAEEDLPQAGPTLTCVTKQRVKGPQGNDTGRRTTWGGWSGVGGGNWCECSSAGEERWYG